MRSPKMTPRRWFWMLTTAVACWLLGTARWGDPFTGSGMAEGPKVALVAVAGPARWLQTRLVRITQDAAGPPGGLALEDRLRHLEDENRRLQTMVYGLWDRKAKLEDALRALQRINDFLPQDYKLVPATVFGGSPTPAAELCLIDRGTLDGVHAGDPVMADYALVGRVVAVSAKNATVRLITDPDPSMRIKARLIRPRADNTYTVIADRDNCLVRGLGGGKLGCDTTTAIGMLPPQIGDVFLLDDRAWGTVAGWLPIGKVTGVARSDKNPVRYDLQIEPQARIVQQMNVWVVVPG